MASFARSKLVRVPFKRFFNLVLVLFYTCFKERIGLAFQWVVKVLTYKTGAYTYQIGGLNYKIGAYTYQIGAKKAFINLQNRCFKLLILFK